MTVRLGVLVLLLVFPAAALGHADIFFPKPFTVAELSNTGFVLLNVDPVTANVKLYLFAPNASGVVLAETPAIQIAPGGQFARLGSELFPGVASGGWVYGVTDTEGMQAFWLNYTNGLTSLDGAEAFQLESVGTDQIVPLATADSELSVISVTGASLSVTVQLFGSNGELAPPFTQSIPAAGAMQVAISQMFPTADLSQARYMRIRSASSLFASMALVRRFGVPFESAVVNGVNAGTSTQMTFAHVVTGVLGGADYTTTIGVTNLSTSAQVLTLTLNPDAGPPITVARSIPGNGALQETAASLFQLSSTFTAGWIRVAGTAPLTGFASYADTAGGGLAMVPAATAQTSLFFSHIANGPPQWQTGLALLNESSSTANVEIYAVTPSGTLIGRTTASIDAGARLARVIHDLIPETKGVNGGYVYVRTTNAVPLHGIELFYTEDMKVMSNVVAGKLLPGVIYVPPTH